MLVMSFGLKNVRATYQKVMNLIFHDVIDKNMEVYIDDVVVKSADMNQHLADLEQALQKMRFHGLQMNPTKCVFDVLANNFLGFLVHQKRTKVDKNKVKLVLEASLPLNKKELQS